MYAALQMQYISGVMNMSIISLQVNDEEKAVLEDAAKFYKCSISTVIKRLTFEKLEDEYDNEGSRGLSEGQGSWNA